MRYNPDRLTESERIGYAIELRDLQRKTQETMETINPNWENEPTPTESEWLESVEKLKAERGIKEKPEITTERKAWIEYNRALELEHAAQHAFDKARQVTNEAYARWNVARGGA